MRGLNFCEQLSGVVYKPPYAALGGNERSEFMNTIEIEIIVSKLPVR